MKYKLEDYKDQRKNGLLKKLYLSHNSKELKNLKDKEMKYLNNIRRVCLDKQVSLMLLLNNKTQIQIK